MADNAVSMGGTGWAVQQFSWDNKYAGVQILLSKVCQKFHRVYIVDTLENNIAALAMFSTVILCGRCY